MGIDSNAYLHYGVQLPSEEDGATYPWDAHDCDFEVWYAIEVLGLTEPNVPFDLDNPEYKKIWCEYLDKRREAIKQNCPFELVYHCSSDYIMSILAIKETCHDAWRGQPVKVDMNKWSNVETIEWNRLLAELCEKYNIPVDETNKQPEWWLCSYMG